MQVRNRSMQKSKARALSVQGWPGKAFSVVATSAARGSTTRRVHLFHALPKLLVISGLLTVTRSY